MKFKYIIANPPFNSGTKMLIKWFELSDNIITVLPSIWLFGKKKNKDICAYILEKCFNMCIESINSNDYFDANIGNLVAIQTFRNINSNNIPYNIIVNNKIYNDINDVSLVSNDVLFNDFKNIVEPLYTKQNLNMYVYKTKHYNTGFLNAIILDDPKDDLYVLLIPTIRGHGTVDNPKPDFYTIISNKEKEMNKKVGLYKDVIKNNDKLLFFFYGTYEYINGIRNYVKTDFCRACLRICKTSSQIGRGELRYVPWFDFSEPVFLKSIVDIDNYLFEKYNISKEIRSHIEKCLPDYYSVRV